MSISVQTHSIRSSRRHGRFRRQSEINVTPFVDVMLVLLIIFMISAPMLTAGVPVDLPNSDANPLTEEDDRPLEITLSENGEIHIGETAVTRERLVPLLSAITENNPDRRIYIRGAENLPYGEVMSIVGGINAAGFRKLALITEPE